MFGLRHQSGFRETRITEVEPLVRPVKMLIGCTLIGAGAYFVFLYLLSNR